MDENVWSDREVMKAKIYGLKGSDFFIYKGLHSNLGYFFLNILISTCEAVIKT